RTRSASHLRQAQIRGDRASGWILPASSPTWSNLAQNPKQNAGAACCRRAKHRAFAGFAKGRAGDRARWALSYAGPLPATTAATRCRPRKPAASVAAGGGLRQRVRTRFGTPAKKGRGHSAFAALQSSAILAPLRVFPLLCE